MALAVMSKFRQLNCLMVACIIFIACFGYFQYRSNFEILNQAPLFQFFQRSDRKCVLVTGGAGFIGFHLAKTLSRNINHQVVVIDNFNDYYDVRLKIDRAYELHKAGVKVYYDDVCDEDFLADTLRHHDVTHVVHLAAQAGVRYSLQNPLAYVTANIQCHLTLLNAVRDYDKNVKLVYASSSSVYGKGAEIPFRLSAATDKPGNMYAATKKTDELLGLHYCQAHGIRSVGLRFFTVYGEWGRPDMSVYKFADAIFHGKEIPMFHVSDEEPLGRDFTYVSDVISGIRAAMDYNPHRCGECFNLGLGHPVPVPDMINILQQELNIKGKVKKLPLPPTEILRTWADIRTSTQYLNFKPKTNLTMGLRAFVRWYKPYIQVREAEVPTSGRYRIPESVVWFTRLTEEQLQRKKSYNKDADRREKDRILARYLQDTESDDIRSSYYQYEKVDPSFNEYDIGTLPNIAGNHEALQKACDAVPACIGFTLEGVLKSALPPRSFWIPGIDTLHVRRVDNVCETRHHMCHPRADCKLHNKNLYECACHDGYHGNGIDCLPVHDHATVHQIYEDNFPIYQSIYNVSQLKQDKKWIEFQGVDSISGDYLLVEGSPSVQELKSICSSQDICIGFSTRGTLKRKLDPPAQWSSVNTSQSLFIYEMNYCQLNRRPCPQFSHCTNKAQGIWDCVCKDGYIMFQEKCIKLFVSPTSLPSLAKYSSGFEGY